MTATKKYTIEFEANDQVLKDSLNWLNNLERKINDTTPKIEAVMRALINSKKGFENSTAEIVKMKGTMLELKPLFDQMSKSIGKAFNIKDATEGAEKKVVSLADQLKANAEKINKELTEIWGSFNTALTSGLAALSGHLAMEKEVADVHLKETTEKYTKVVEERKKSAAAIIDLENKVKNARGGRAVALQEQISSEMANNQKLAEQEAKLAKDKEKAEKEKAKTERKEKKQTIAKGIIESYANIALGVTKAMALGPILGPPFAIMIAAAGAAQIAVQAKQLSKLADGGMLRGKRHSEGGMRVEGTNIEVEGGEYVINRQSTDRNLELVRYINTQRRELTQEDINSFFARTVRGYEPAFRQAFAEGGQVPVMSEPILADNSQLLDAIRDIKFEPKVAVTDIVRAQESMVSVDAWVGI